MGGTLIGVILLVLRHAWLSRHLPRVAIEPLGTILTLSVPVLKAWGFDHTSTPHAIRFGPGLYLTDFSEVKHAPKPMIIGAYPGQRLELDYYIDECPERAMNRGNRCLMTVRFLGEYTGTLEDLHHSDLIRSVYYANDWSFGYPQYEDGLHAPEKGVPIVLRELRSPLLRDVINIVDESTGV